MRLTLTLTLDSPLIVGVRGVPTPAQIIGDALYAWYDAQNDSSVVLDGNGKVQQVNSSGGSGAVPVLNDQPTQRPALAAAINGKQAFNFVASASQSLWSNPGAWGLLQPFTLVLVGKAPLQSAQRSLIGDGANSTRFTYDSVPELDMYAGGAANITAGGVSNDVPFWAVGHFADAASYIRVNGGAKFGSGTSVGTATYSRILLAGAGFSTFMDCTIGEVIFSTGDLTDTQVAELGAYFARWGL